MMSDDDELITNHAGASGTAGTSGARAAAASRDHERQRLLGGSDDEDDFFLHGPKIGGLRKEVEGVTNMVKENVNKMIDRGVRLEDLERQAESLDMGAHEFRTSANRMRRKFWWENQKAKLAIGGSISVIVIILIIIISA